MNKDVIKTQKIAIRKNTPKELWTKPTKIHKSKAEKVERIKKNEAKKDMLHSSDSEWQLQ